MAKRTDVYDGKGKKIGTINHDVFRDNYYDSAGRFLGSTDEHGIDAYRREAYSAGL